MSIFSQYGNEYSSFLQIGLKSLRSYPALFIMSNEMRRWRNGERCSKSDRKRSFLVLRSSTKENSQASSINMLMRISLFLQIGIKPLHSYPALFIMLDEMRRWKNEERCSKMIAKDHFYYDPATNELAGLFYQYDICSQTFAFISSPLHHVGRDASLKEWRDMLKKWLQKPVCDNRAMPNGSDWRD